MDYQIPGLQKSQDLDKINIFHVKLFGQEIVFAPKKKEKADLLIRIEVFDSQ
jgi:hypothetical protein